MPMVPRVPAAAVMPEAPGDLAQTFSIAAETQVPGKVLKPGSYTLRVVDHLRDRVVLRIESSDGKSESLFLGLPNNSLGATTGPVSWGKAGRHTAMKGFIFPGGNAVEFVYQKEQAVEIAKATSQKVPAIDPASEGMPANTELSHDDMAMITLWKLSPTEVGPQAGIQAERVTPAPAPAPVQTAQTAQTTQTAPVNRKAAAPASSTTTTAAAAVPVHRQKPAPSPATQVATLHRPALASTLPQTGSELPVVLLAGIALLGTAGGLRLSRTRKS